MKNKILTITILTFLLLMSSATALLTTSADYLPFVEETDIFYGQAFVISATENSVDEKLFFSELSSQVAIEGNKLEGTGFIEGDYINSRFFYDDSNVGTLYHPYIAGKILITTDSDTWCKNKVGNKPYTVVWNGQFACISVNPIGTYSELGSGDLQFETTVTVNANGDTQIISLNQNQQRDTLKYSTDGDFAVEITGFVSSGRGKPTVNADIGVYKPNTGAEYTIDKFDYSRYTAQQILDRYKDYHSGFAVSFENAIDFMVNDVNSRLTFSGDSYGSGTIFYESGGVVYDDIYLYEFPVYRIIVDAEWVGIGRPSGIPRIDSFEIGDIVEGDDGIGRGSASITITNIADDTGNFDINIQCTGLTVDPSEDISFQAKATRTILLDVSGSTNSGSSSYSCQAVVTDITSGVSASATATGVIKEVNQCPESNVYQCIGNTIQRCSEINGVLVWVDTLTCTIECKQTGDVAECVGTSQLASCEDGRKTCDAGENMQTCPNDCTVRNDGYCGIYERVDGTDPESCELGGTGTSDLLLAVIIIGGVGIALAVFITMRREGIIGGKQQ